MKISTKLAAVSGLAVSLLPLAARAADDFTDTTDYSATTASTTAASGAILGGFIFFWIIWLIFFVVGILLFIFWIFMLIDVFKRTNWKQENDKIVWMLVVILLGGLGAVIYYFVEKKALDAPKKSNKK
jgi:RsiW-degrading membrane proteinase PrsW (M82 family)